MQHFRWLTSQSIVVVLLKRPSVPALHLPLGNMRLHNYVWGLMSKRAGAFCFPSSSCSLFLSRHLTESLCSSLIRKALGHILVFHGNKRKWHISFLASFAFRRFRRALKSSVTDSTIHILPFGTLTSNHLTGMQKCLPALQHAENAGVQKVAGTAQ